MASLSSTAVGAAWLLRFAPEERDAAAALMDEVLLVGRDEFHRGLGRLIARVGADRLDLRRPIGLFAERRVAKVGEAILPIFPGAGSGRATGPGVPPIAFEDDDPEVGSEGPVASLITGYCRAHRPAALSHPGPDRMRDGKVGDVVIVTDFIGSGKRVWEMLEAFRQVATLRSWRSYGLLRFSVIAYSATELGLEVVATSRLKPRVLTVAGCPTIAEAFRGAQRAAIYDLCVRHPRRSGAPFGYRGGGALIAFAHGMPNNSPAILHSTKGGWQPLFRNRSTEGAASCFPPDAADDVGERASRLLRIQGAWKYLSDPRARQWISTMLVLAAIDAGGRTAAAVSATCRLPVAEVTGILEAARVARWLGSRNALTQLGRQELAGLRRRRQRAPVLPTEARPYYFPTQLRAR